MTDVLTPVAAGVRAALNYVTDTGEKPVSETGGADGLMRTYRASFEPHIVTIEDGRPRRAEFSLDVSGFELADHTTKVKDFFDAEELARVYYPEAAALIAARSGAKR